MPRTTTWKLNTELDGLMPSIFINIPLPVVLLKCGITYR